MTGNQEQFHAQASSDSSLDQALAELSDQALLFILMANSAHSVELAGRVYTPRNPDEATLTSAVVHKAFSLVGRVTTTGLNDLWGTWKNQRPELHENQSALVPAYLLHCIRTRNACIRELASRCRRRTDRAVYKSFARIHMASPEESDIAINRFLSSMDRTRRSTVKRSLAFCNNDGSVVCHDIEDMSNIALLGATQKETHGRAAIVRLLNRGGPIKTRSGETIQVPTLPELPSSLLGPRDELATTWCFIGKQHAYTLFARIAPGLFGILETVLPDAAGEAQRRERDAADSQDRGGPGVPKTVQARKAKARGLGINPETLETSRAVHIPITEKHNSSVMDDRPNQMEEIEHMEEDVGTNATAALLMELSIEKWGEAGRKMLEAIKNGKTDKEAAEAAGISPPAFIKRRDTLRKLFLSSVASQK
jgi:hypothetical protein